MHQHDRPTDLPTGIPAAAIPPLFAALERIMTPRPLSDATRRWLFRDELTAEELRPTDGPDYDETGDHTDDDHDEMGAAV